MTYKNICKSKNLMTVLLGPLKDHLLREDGVETLKYRCVCQPLFGKV